MNKIPLQDGELYYHRDFLSQEESKIYMEILQQGISWEREEVVVFGKRHWVPRLVAWHGDPGVAYGYAGTKKEALGWTAELEEIKNRIENVFPSASFNSVLLNYYRDGSDKMGWHSDDEKELGVNPVIASVSLGATRRFDLRHKKTKEQIKIELSPGSLLIMSGSLQHHWHHSLPAQKRVQSPRINLTFRRVF